MVVSKCEKALNGTELLKLELGVPAEVEPPLVEPLLDEPRTRAGADKVAAEGVYTAAAVVAFDPAEVEPCPDEEAAAPLCPEEEFAWM